MGSLIVYVPDPENDLEIYRDYLLQLERAKSTIDNYMRGARLFLRFATEQQTTKDRDLAENRSVIDKETLIEFKDYLWEHYKPASCNAIIAGVNQFLESLGFRDLKVRQFRMQGSMMRPQDQYLTESECKKLIDAARSMQKKRLANAMEAIVMTGARISELRYFTVESVSRGEIRVRNKGKIRMILLPKALRKHLMLYAAKQNIKKGSIFITASGKPVDRSNFWREMQRLADETNVLKKKIFPHNLRHLFAHVYFQMTKDLAGLGDILGHSSLNVTRIYTLKTIEMQRKMLDRLGDVFIKKADRRSAYAHNNEL